MRISLFKIAVLLLMTALASCQKSKSPYNGTFTSTASFAGLAVKPGKLDLNRPLSKRKTKARKTHFIEFRARNAESYGHAFVVLGKLNSRGRVPTDKKGVLIVGQNEVAGLHPRTTSPQVFSMGHVVPVLAETGWSDGDSEDEYVLARYRIDLTKAEFKQVVALVKHRKASARTWHALTNNCVTFIRQVAKDMGLKTPLPPTLPQGFVNGLKRLNG